MVAQVRVPSRRRKVQVISLAASLLKVDASVAIVFLDHKDGPVVCAIRGSTIQTSTMPAGVHNIGCGDSSLMMIVPFPWEP